jgi:hypothetical protein
MIAATQRPSGVQMSTEIRTGLITKISYRILDSRTQEMTGIKGSENLKQGEFMIITELESGTKKLKGFYVDRLEEWTVFNELKSKLGGSSYEKIVYLDKK